MYGLKTGQKMRFSFKSSEIRNAAFKEISGKFPDIRVFKTDTLYPGIKLLLSGSLNYDLSVRSEAMRIAKDFGGQEEEV